MARLTVRVPMLLACIARAGESAAKYPGRYQASDFIAHLCGGLQQDHPDIAKALADGAGLSHLYAPKAAEVF
ncbi:MAG: hypothetical protein EPN57_20430 [Paraburkholderia sp.]|nr:MAG: hypothetical protein EPN57_20430 [Paraburkholderia sp.]